MFSPGLAPIVYSLPFFKTGKVFPVVGSWIFKVERKLVFFEPDPAPLVDHTWSELFPS